MAGGLLPINFVTNQRTLAFSESDPSQVNLPRFYQEESPLIGFKALRRLTQMQAPFMEKLLLTGYSLQISIGTAGTVHAAQNAWTISADNYELQGALNLNTSGINTALAAANPSALTFEIRLFDGTNYFRGAFPVLVYKSVALAAALVPPAGDTALGALEAKRIYMKKEGEPGEGFILTSADGLRQGLCYWHNDGSWRAEGIV